jgi:hypothetical protein
MKTVRKRKKRKRNPSQTIEAVKNLIMRAHIQKEMACYPQQHIFQSQENCSQIFSYVSKSFFQSQVSMSLLICFQKWPEVSKLSN